MSQLPPPSDSLESSGGGAGGQPPRRSSTAIWVTAIIVVGALILAGIIAWSVVSASSGSSAGSTPTPTPTPTPSASGSTTPTPPPTNVVTADCTVSQLSVSLGSPDGAAGSQQVPILFTNTSSGSCLLEGFPGVSWVGDGNGTQLGTPADRASATQIVYNTLTPGDSVQALLTIGDAANFDGCQPTTPDGLRVYPPHSYYAVFVPTTQFQACANAAVHQLLVQPVLPVG